MKAIILAADPEVVISSSENDLPRCLLPLHHDVTILERQIRTLNLHGIATRDIVVVIGEQGPWAKPGIIDRVRDIHSHIAINSRNAETGIAASLDTALEKIDCEDDLLIIDGDLIFDSRILDCLLAVDDANALLTRRALSIAEHGSRVHVEQGRVVRAGRSVEHANNYPWHLYSGIAYIRKDTTPLLRARIKHHSKGDLLDVVTEIALDCNFVIVDHTKPTAGENGMDERLADLTGGSYAALKLRRVVRKEASGRGKKKLHNEINWLLGLPENLQAYFPKVSDYYLGDDNLWCEMPFYDRPSLRKLLMTGEYDAGDACSFLARVFDFMFENIYSREIRPAPPGWIIDKHLSRLHKRLIQSLRQSKSLARLIEAEIIVINGRNYRNIPDLSLEISRRSSLLEALAPAQLRMVHGDLHFQNILVGPMENDTPFLLIDPRGEMSGSDLFYDLGKIYHSVNGMYDFLHTDQFELSMDSTRGGKNIAANLTFTNKQALHSYIAIGEALPDLLQKYYLICNDKNSLMKSLFAEAMHFCSVMPFHLQGDGQDQRAAAMYLTGVKLLNEFWEKFEVFTWPEDKTYIHINSQEDYVRALGLIASGEISESQGRGE